MGYSIFSSKAIIFYKKCQFCYSSGKVAWMNKDSDRSGNALNLKFRRGFLGGPIYLFDKWMNRKKNIICAIINSQGLVQNRTDSYVSTLFSRYSSQNREN